MLPGRSRQWQRSSIRSLQVAVSSRSVVDGDARSSPQTETVRNVTMQPGAPVVVPYSSPDHPADGTLDEQQAHLPSNPSVAWYAVGRTCSDIAPLRSSHGYHYRRELSPSTGFSSNAWSRNASGRNLEGAREHIRDGSEPPSDAHESRSDTMEPGVQRIQFSRSSRQLQAVAYPTMSRTFVSASHQSAGDLLVRMGSARLLPSGQDFVNFRTNSISLDGDDTYEEGGNDDEDTLNLIASVSEGARSSIDKPHSATPCGHDSRQTSGERRRVHPVGMGLKSLIASSRSLPGFPKMPAPGTLSPDDSDEPPAASDQDLDGACRATSVRSMHSRAKITRRHAEQANTPDRSPLVRPAAVSSSPEQSSDMLSAERAAISMFGGSPTARGTREVRNARFSSYFGIPLGFETPVAYYHESVAIMFVYVTNLRSIAARGDGIQLVKELNRLLVDIDRIVEDCRAYKIMAIADMYMCIAGDSIATTTRLPGENHVLQLCKVALGIMRLVREKHFSVGGTPLYLQVGINCGPVASGVIGSKTLNYHVFGDAVNVASRMCSTAYNGRIQLSFKAAEYLQQHGRWHRLLEERGEIMVKGKGLMRTFWLPSDVGQDDLYNRRTMTPFVLSTASNQPAPSLPLPASASPPYRRGRRLARRASERTSIIYLEAFLRESAKAQATPLGFGSLAFISSVPNPEAPANEETSIPPNSTGRFARSAGMEADEKLASAVGAFEIESQYTAYKAKKQRDEVNRAVPMQFVASLSILLLQIIALEREANTYYGRLSLIMHVLACITLGLCSVFHWIRHKYCRGPNKSNRSSGLPQDHTEVANIEGVAPERSCLEFCCGSKEFMGRTGPTGVCQTESTMLAVAAMVLALSLTVAAQLLSPVHVDLLVEAVLAVHVAILIAHFRGLLATFVAIVAALLGTAAAIPGGNIREIVLTLVILLASALAVSTQAYAAEKQNRVKFTIQLRALELSAKCQDLLRNMLPSGYHVERLMRDEEVVEELDNVVMLYSDIVGYTSLASKLTPKYLIILLHDLYEGFDQKIVGSRSGLYKMETIGDAFIVLGGLRGASAADRSRQAAVRARRGRSIPSSISARDTSSIDGLHDPRNAKPSDTATAHDPGAGRADVRVPGHPTSDAAGAAAGCATEGGKVLPAGVAGRKRSSGSGNESVLYKKTSIFASPMHLSAAHGKLQSSNGTDSTSSSPGTSFLVGEDGSFRAQFNAVGEQMGISRSILAGMHRISDGSAGTMAGVGQSIITSSSPDLGVGKTEVGSVEALRKLKYQPSKLTGAFDTSRPARPRLEKDGIVEDPAGSSHSRHVRLSTTPSYQSHRASVNTRARYRSKLASSARAVARFAVDMLEVIQDIRERHDLPTFSMRIGIHVGGVVGGILGESRPRYFVWGYNTAIAYALESSCPPGQILVSEGVVRLLYTSTSGAIFDEETTIYVEGSEIRAYQLRAVGSRFVGRYP